MEFLKGSVELTLYMANFQNSINFERNFILLLYFKKTGSTILVPKIASGTALASSETTGPPGSEARPQVTKKHR
jgi:hypothetical protein